ncbi:MAG: class I SAM-dependent methyltransferase [bacterium]
METVPGSFRDPSGFLFFQDGCLYRQVNKVYREDYDLLISSGLYDTLVKSGLLVAHEEVDLPGSEPACKILKPELIPFISYPYEWCFSQLKAAALTTLRIQKTSLSMEMSLKDSSAYNIQFLQGRPVLIDTLSFERYREGTAWVAYKQFCQHFLAPLALMSYTDIRLNQLSRVFIDGVPLDLASALLPSGTKYKFSLLSHIHLHAKSQKRYGDKDKNKEIKNPGISKTALLGIIDSLESAVGKLKWKSRGTEWGDYYDKTNYSPDSFEFKKKLVERFLEKSSPKTVWDLGANTGVFSRLASDKGRETVSFDVDPAAVELNYLESVKNKDTGILPLLLDLTNPSPGIGWEHKERMSLLERGPVDAVMALALIHHLAISNNLPLEKIAGFFHEICRYLIIEFVPKSDSQVQKLLTNREDIFPDYTRENFEKVFSEFFAIENSEEIKDSDRVLYLMLAREI